MKKERILPDKKHSEWGLLANNGIYLALFHPETTVKTTTKFFVS